MKLLELALAVYLALGALAFTAWATWTWSRTSLAPKADPTTRVIWYVGAAMPWLFALLVAGAVLGVVARGVFTLLGGA
jgi:hypothetical protein